MENATLNHSGRRSSRCHFPLVSHEGVALCDGSDHFRMCYIAMVFLPDWRDFPGSLNAAVTPIDYQIGTGYPG